MTHNTIFGRVGALALGLALAFGGIGAAAANQLDDIKARGVLEVAVDVGNPPFAMMDANFQPTGSEIETAKLMAHDLGVDIKFLTVPTSGRIQFLVSGKADVAISTLSITPERLQVVDFSIPYSESTIIVAAAKELPLTSYADLGGMSVAVTRGTVNDTLLTDSTVNVPNVEIVRFEDDPTASAAVVSGQFKVYATSRPLLQQLKQSNPNLDLEEKFVGKAFPLGVAIRKGQPELTAWINSWIKTNLDNGKLIDIYQKYHGARLDPAELAAMDVPR